MLAFWSDIQPSTVFVNFFGVRVGHEDGVALGAVSPQVSVYHGEKRVAERLLSNSPGLVAEVAAGWLLLVDASTLFGRSTLRLWHDLDGR